MYSLQKGLILMMHRLATVDLKSHELGLARVRSPHRIPCATDMVPCVRVVICLWRRLRLKKVVAMVATGLQLIVLSMNSVTVQK